MRNQTNATRNILVVLCIVSSILLASCGINRTDAKAVSEGFFRAIMDKDYQKVQDLMGSGGSVPSTQAWKEGSFLYDNNKVGIKDLWMKGQITGYQVGEIVIQDYGSILPTTKKLVTVNFTLNEKKYIAVFAINPQGNEWYPVWTQWIMDSSLIAFALQP